jgi:phage gp36-like protein
MSYCATEDLNERLSNDELIQLTDDSNTGTVDQAIVSRAIAAAQDTIDGYIRGRYAVPLVSVPGVIKNISADLAAYNLFKRRNQLAVNEARELMYKKAVTQLKDIQTGTILLETATGEALAPRPLMKTNKRTSDRQFGKDRLEEF